MKRMRLFIGALVPLVSLLALGEAFPVLTVGFWRLSLASRFVMFSGIENPYAQLPEAKLFLRIYGSRDPEAAFVQLYRFGNQQAKAFALYGLHEIGSDRFEEMASSFVTSGGEVRLVVTTCSASEVPAATVLEFIREWSELVRSSILREEALKKEAAEPSATDNPDDAQRLREDY